MYRSWSLGVEEQFYLLFPFAAALCARKPRLALWLAIAVCAASIGACLGLQLGASAWFEPDAAFYLMPTRAWQLLSGVGLCLLHHHRRDRPSVGTTLGDEEVKAAAGWLPATSSMVSVRMGSTFITRLAVLWARLVPRAARLLLLEAVSVSLLAFGLSSSRGSAFLPLGNAFFPIPFALPAVFGTLGYIAVGHMARESGRSVTGERDGIFLSVDVVEAEVPSLWVPRCNVRLPLPLLNHFLERPACVYVGQLSYAIYLWHWPIFVLLRWSVGFYCSLWRLSAVAATLMLSVASHHFIEKPVQRLGTKRRRLVTALPLLMAALTAGLLFALRGPLLGRWSLAPPPSGSAPSRLSNSTHVLPRTHHFASTCACTSSSRVAAAALLGRGVRNKSGWVPYNADSAQVCYSSLGYTLSYRADCESNLIGGRDRLGGCRSSRDSARSVFMVSGVRGSSSSVRIHPSPPPHICISCKSLFLPECCAARRLARVQLRACH